jgi:hypothetical protein
MMVPEDILLEAMTAAVNYDNAPWLRKQMCAKLRESIRIEGKYLAVPLMLPVVRDDGR